MNRAIITYAAGEHERLLELSLPTFRRFADKHGYDLIVGEKMTDRPPAWNKIPLLATHSPKYEQVVWFDADLFIVDDSDDLPRINESHGLVRHFTAGSEVPNSGMWILNYRPAFDKIFDAIWNLEVFMNHGWWEQAALLTLMGYCVPPEGSDFDDTKCRCVYETELMKACQFLRVEWNSHPNYQANKPRIVHCSYPDMDTRVEVMRRLAEDPGYAYPAWPKKEEKE